MAANRLFLRTASGDHLEASTDSWVIAILSVLEPDQLTRVFQKAEQLERGIGVTELAKPPTQVIDVGGLRVRPNGGGRHG